MRYELLKAIVSTYMNDKGKMVTPIIGYVLYDHLEGRDGVFNRKDAYEAVREFGATNVIAKVRTEWFEQDLPDADGNVHYLELTDGKKINDYFLQCR